MDGDGWLELDDFGVPLGRWSWDDEEEMWIFDEFPPLSEMPQTGDNSNQDLYLIVFGLSLLGMIVAIKFIRKLKVEILI
jgi:LPXTG-motif cell wall-anchored protein